MESCRSGVRAVGLVLGAWGFFASLFLTFFLTFRTDAWQIFGTLMLPIIIILTLNLLACLCWIYGMAIVKTRFMLISICYWIIPMFYSIRFVWNPVRRNAVNTGDNMHYFNTEEDDLTVRFEMTMTQPHFLIIYSAIFITSYLIAILIYMFMLITRPGEIEDSRFNVQNVYTVPSLNLEKSGLEKI
ncbi:uncharacterized protein LOC116347241 [Contarinia nasturtii]|uniref:uncharacterized protein LOC116347241 n=1 Tax=Contarinia nasturtii TaxID=265458 RepID=UPI0012D494EE|nr:uncharacterized protein LOC116347241 [Contarinia nasturtii]XP_031633630.1 uncharacterized protein LOC116347241 [Contarinia nasturtii]XP_031633631.1 uncharacterized protein LOC116347241 [Contarinia nasturtii]